MAQDAYPINRRRCLGGFGVVALGLLGAADFAEPGVRRAQQVLMGTQVGLVAHGTDRVKTDAAMDAAFREMGRLERLMSRYRDDSQISALERAAGRYGVAVAPQVLSVLQRAQQLSKLTDGAFDITIGAYAGWDFKSAYATPPSALELERQRTLVAYRDLELDVAAGRAYLRRPGMRIDLGGIAKLPILQAGLAVLQQHYITNAMIDGGGDVLTLGALQGRRWRVGVRDPQQPQTLLGTLELNTGVVASSGDYERYFMHAGRRYHHLLDPRTGYPVAGLRGLTLFGHDSTVLNGLGAAMMLMGPERSRSLLARQSGVEGLTVDASGHLWLSVGMPLKSLQTNYLTS